MDGLNDGLELDEERVDVEKIDSLFLSKELGQVPELDADILLVQSINNTVADLTTLHEDIVRNGGMDKTFAMEAESIMPSFPDVTKPLYCFTDFPSRTMYSASLEAIASEKKSLIRRIIEIIYNSLLKSLEWFKKVLSFVSNDENKKMDQEVHEFVKDDAQKTKDSLQALQRANHDPAETIKLLSRVVKNPESREFQKYVMDLEETLQNSKSVSQFYSQIQTRKLAVLLITDNSFGAFLRKCFLSAYNSVDLFKMFENSNLLGDFATLGMTIGKTEETALAFRRIMDRNKSKIAAENFKTLEEALRMRVSTQAEVELTPESYSLVQLYAALKHQFLEFEAPYPSTVLGEFTGRLDKILGSLKNVMRDLDSAQIVDLADQEKHRIVSQTLREAFEEVKAIAGIAGTYVRGRQECVPILKILRDQMRRFEDQVTKNLSDLDPDSAQAVAAYFKMRYKVVGRPHVAPEPGQAT